MNISRLQIIRLAVFGSLGFLVLILILLFVTRDNLFRFMNDPRDPFQTYTPPAAPDYAQNKAWALAPAQTDDAQTTHVFVVTPSVYWGGKDWNTPLDAPRPLRRLQRTAIPNWAGPFQGVGAVAIPLYRSASLYSFLTVRSDARDARALAYTDVLKAFDRFIAQIDAKAPIILAGSEQGGLHVLGLLQDRFNDPYLRERLAAAYVVDFAVPLDLFDGPLAGLAPCKTAEDSRCIIAYGAFQKIEKAEIKRFVERSMVWGAHGKLHVTRGRALTCVNPALGSTSNDSAPKEQHRGAVAATGLEWGIIPAPIPEQTASQCVDGILLVDRPKSRALHKKFGFGERFKPDTFNLFYADLAHDAKQRVQNLRTRFKAEGRLAPPFGDVMEIIEAPILKVPEN